MPNRCGISSHGKHNANEIINVHQFNLRETCNWLRVNNLPFIFVQFTSNVLLMVRWANIYMFVGHKVVLEDI